MMTPDPALPTFWQRPVLHEPTLADLVSRKTLSQETASLLAEVTKSGGRVLAYGNAGTGKTTLADALTAHLPLGAGLARYSRTERSLARHGLSELTSAPGSVTVTRVDDDPGRLRDLLGGTSSVLATLRAGSLHAVTDLVGSNPSLPFDVVVEVKKHTDDSSGKTLRYVSFVLVRQSGALEELEQGFVNPWGEVLWRRHEAASARSRHLSERLGAGGTPAPRPAAASSGFFAAASGMVLRNGASAGPTSPARSSTTQTPGTAGSVLLARDFQGLPVELSARELSMHAVVLGSTGSGKSVVLQTLVAGLLDQGWDGLVVDNKDDCATGGFRDFCERAAASRALPYQEFSSTQSSSWLNPLAGLGVDEARDTILGMQSFDSGYYEALNKQQLGELLTLLYAANEIDPEKFPTPTFGEIGRILSANAIKTAVKAQLAVVTTQTSYTQEDFVSLSGVDKNFNETARGLGARIRTTVEAGPVHSLLEPGAPLSGGVDVTDGGLTYVGLDSTGKPGLSRLISTAVLKRMSVYASDRIAGKVRGDESGKPKPRFLVIDEADFVDRMALVALLGRARSAGVSVILATQGPLDWKGAPGEAGWGSIAQNTNVHIVLSQGDRQSADACSDLVEPALAGLGEVDFRAFGIGELVLHVTRPSTRVVRGKAVFPQP